MHLGVARLCLDCHELHEHDRCPACTSEAFAFITRWIKVEDVAPRTPTQRDNTSTAVEKIDTYRQILQPRASGSRAGKWLRNGGLLVAAGYVARWGWHLAGRRTHDSDDENQKRSSA
jgi:hypothetical protein